MGLEGCVGTLGLEWKGQMIGRVSPREAARDERGSRMQPQRKGPYLHDLNEGKGWKKAFLGTWSLVLKETQWAGCNSPENRELRAGGRL